MPTQGHSKHLGPPGDTFLDRFESRSHARGVRFAEHHVVGALLGREHGIMPCRQSAGARDALRLEVGKRFAERGNASEMSAVGARTRDQFDTAVKQQRGVSVLHQVRPAPWRG